MPNRLAAETSPYLRQHADNPVDWYPWGPEALDRAHAEQRPILLSVGYAACHWCHVMEHESFEDPDTARLMNELFVNIKVDREERPDLDAIYMQAVQAMTGHGGWPMTVFLTPDGVPFFGGTYFPPADRYGQPSFRRVLTSIAQAWRERKDEVDLTAARMRELYAATSEKARSMGALSGELLDRAFRSIAQRYDYRSPGFDAAPRFPQTMALDFALRYWRRTGVQHALEIAQSSFTAMARGGIYDQLGGGFHRYSVDARWLVPHFEKMLYDNALLARLGLHLYQATGSDEARRTAEHTFEWVAREMLSREGGFYSSLDADSEGEEGRFYTWEERELDALLGDDARVVKEYYGVTPEGNFEGRSILSRPAPASMIATRLGVTEETVTSAVARATDVLMRARARRVRPGLDDKVLASWNGLMLRTIAEAARILDRNDLRDLALRSADFLFTGMIRDGRVMRSWKDGELRHAGLLEDYAALGLAALAMYELTFDSAWVTKASDLAGGIVRLFWDDDAGAFFDTPADHEPLITRPRDPTDNAVPSGTSLAVELLLRLAVLRHDVDARRRAAWVLETLAEPMSRFSIAFGHMLGAADLEVNGAVEVAIAGAGDGGENSLADLPREVARHYLPALVLAAAPDSGTRSDAIALLEGREARGGKATAYVCREYVCLEPVTDGRALGEQLERAAAGKSSS